MAKEKFERKRFSCDGVIEKNGEYVLTPVEQEDGSTSFWLAKEGYMVAHYCFTIGHGGSSYQSQINEIKQYINLYRNKFEKEDSLC